MLPSAQINPSSQSLSAPKHGAPSTQQEDDSCTESLTSMHDPDAHVKFPEHQLTSQHGSDASPHPNAEASTTPGDSQTPAAHDAPDRHQSSTAELKTTHLSSSGRSSHVQHGCVGSPQSATHVQVSGAAAPAVASTARAMTSARNILGYQPRALIFAPILSREG
jgi:hypothetical protein